MNHLSLFSGIGGLDLGAEWAGFKTVCFVENNDFCQKVLQKHWPSIPIIPDVHKVTKKLLDKQGNKNIDIISGGFPCQPFSHAGKRSGKVDNRYLWPEMLRVIREVKPTYVVGENVYGLVTNKGGAVLETIYTDLETEGYEVTPPIVFPAAAVGALHRRDRVWICAYSGHNNGSPKLRLKQKEWAKIFSRGSQTAYSRLVSSTAEAPCPVVERIAEREVERDIRGVPPP